MHLLDVTCGVISAGVETVDVPVDATHPIGTSYTYECNDGYKYSGDKVTNCEDVDGAGTWSLVAPNCTGKLGVHLIL